MKNVTRFAAVSINLATAVCFSASAILGSSSVPRTKDVDLELKLAGEVYGIKISKAEQKQFRGETIAPIQFFSQNHIPGAHGYMTSSVVVSTAQIKSFYSMEDVLEVREIPFTNSYLIKTRTPMAAARLVSLLQKDPTVQFAHPDFILSVEPRNAPAMEPYFEAQWNLKNNGQRGATPGVDIGVEAAWAVTKGRPETIVAVLDLGFEQNHKDLHDAWFVNSREIAGNKKDDDGNGLIDDISGWNFSTNSPNLIYGAAPNHGTATAGVVGARANGIGITGVCPECKILPIVVSGRVSEDASAIGYAMAMGATVMTNSWGYTLESPRTDVVYNALQNAERNGRGGKGIPILFAMRNTGTDDCRSNNPDISAHPDVIAVSSVDFHDVKVPTSGYGRCLAFVAPTAGSAENGIPSTDRPGEKGYNADGHDNFDDLDFHRGFWGTSAATPQVAGIFGLLLSAKPELTRDEALARVKAAAIKVNPSDAHYDPQTGHSLKYGFGRLHAGKLFDEP